MICLQLRAFTKEDDFPRNKTFMNDMNFRCCKAGSVSLTQSGDEIRGNSGLSNKLQTMSECILNVQTTHNAADESQVAINSVQLKCEPVSKAAN